MFIQSIYNHIFRKENDWYIYNAQTNFLGRVSKEFIDIIQSGKWDQLDESTLKFLQTQHIIELAGHEFDYFDLQHLKFNARTNDPTILSLVIAPTTACNFKCPYCFEPKLTPKVITDEVINHLIEFIKSQKEAKRMNLTWYGGEPLLAFPQIKLVYEAFKDEAVPAVVSTSIVTNGSLINEEICDFFNENGLGMMQITLDGNEQSHNITRCFKANSAPSFSVIYDNIRLVRERIPKCQIMIRVNVDKKNLNSFVELHQKVSSDFSNDPMIHVYPGFIRAERPDGKAMTQECVIARDLMDVYEYFRKNGIEQNIFPEMKQRGCMINSLYSYIIGPEGEIYKCWNDVSKPDRVLSNIKDYKLSNKSILTQYMLGGSPFRSTCKKCKVFPICDTGCGYYQVKNEYENGEFDLCSAFKNDSILEKALLDGSVSSITKVKEET